VAAPADEHAAAGHQHFATSREKYEAAAAALAPVIEQYGSYPSGRTAAFYLGASLAELGRYDEAVSALEAAAEAGAPLIRGMALQRLGDLYVQIDRFDDAIRIFDRLVNGPPAGFPVEEALAAKARAHEAAGDDQAAMVAYQRIAEDHPTSVYALPAQTRAEELAAKLGVDLAAQS
jgi:tetratricopeptide (TPR) repeat protein